MSYFNGITQKAAASVVNSTVAPLNAGLSFVGQAESTLGVAALQAGMKADQNATVYIEQTNGLAAGPGTVTTAGTTALSGLNTTFQSLRVGDAILVSGETVRYITVISSDTALTVNTAFSTSAGTLSYQIYNWDISDAYSFYASIGNFGVTVQAILSYFRVRVTNTAATNMTYLRMQSVLCPIVEAVPRSLSAEGNLKVVVQDTQDHYGFEVENTPHGEARSAQPYRLVGTVFTGGVLDTNFWTAAGIGVGGSAATVADAQVVLNTGTTANTSVTLVSIRTARYVGGSANRFRAVIRLPDTGTANNLRRWGAFIAAGSSLGQGCFFELNGTTFKVMTRKNDTDAPVLNGAFNGVLGATYVLDVKAHAYEIYWTNGKVYFTVDGKLLHIVSADAAPWTGSTHLPCRVENTNSNNSISDVAINVRSITISRLGRDQTASIWKNLNTATAATVLKYGPGTLRTLTHNNTGVSNRTATLYDGVTAANPICVIPAANSNPNLIYNLDFYTGLTIAIASGGTSPDVTVVYE